MWTHFHHSSVARTKKIYGVWQEQSQEMENKDIDFECFTEFEDANTLRRYSVLSI